MALLCSDAVQVAPLRLCSYLLFYLLLISIFTHITSALITYDKGTLLDIGHRFTNLLQDTLSPNSSWPPEILRNVEENNGHRRRNKKHRGKSPGIRNRLRKRAHSPPLPSILLANVQSLKNKMDDLRARISFQRDIRDCKGEREVVCGQVWWPILGICPLHLTHPSAHSQQWTHTRSSGQPFCGARGAVGGSVPCSRVSPQSWYWRWREHLLFTPPTDNPCRTWESNLQPLGYKSNSLTIRPRLPPW